jgi:hypothetical protein
VAVRLEELEQRSVEPLPAPAGTYLMLRKYSPEAERRTSTTSPSTSTGCETDSAVSSKRNFVPRSSGRWLGSEHATLADALGERLQQRLRAPVGDPQPDRLDECGVAGTFIGGRQSARKVEVPTSPRGYAHPSFWIRNGKKWYGVDQQGSPAAGNRVFRASTSTTSTRRGRTSLPAKLRETLVGAYDERLIVTTAPRPVPARLPGAGVGAARGLLATRNPMEPGVKTLMRLYVAPAQECPLDKLGRILIPPVLPEPRRPRRRTWSGREW